MQTIEKDGHTVKLYAEFDEFPAARKTAWHKYLIESGELENSLEGIKNRVAQTMEAVAGSRNEEATLLLTNLYYSLNAIESGYDANQLAFGVIVASIDDVPQTDLSAEGLSRLVAKCSAFGVTDKEMSDAVQDVKKNSQPAETAITLGLL